MNISKIEDIALAEVLRLSQEELELETSGISMRPFFDTGSLITVVRIEPENIKIGDIILFKADQYLVTHRVIKKIKESGENYFIEKGDNNSLMTSVSFKDYIGKVVFVKRGSNLDLIKGQPNQGGNNQSIKGLSITRVDTLFSRVLGLALSMFDHLIKNMISVMLQIKEQYCKNKGILNLILGFIIYSLKYFKILLQGAIKFLLFNIMGKIKG